MPNGEMSVAEMRKKIEQGNVVSYRGRILRNVADLPTEADNAVTLAEKQAALKQLQAEHADRQQEIDRLTADIEDLQTRPATPEPSATGAATVNAKPATGAPAQVEPPNQQAGRVASGDDDDEEDHLKNPDQEFAGHKLRFFFDMTKTAKDEAEARSRVMSVKGVGEATADQIIAALKDDEGE
jgi:hypothetical protein